MPVLYCSQYGFILCIKITCYRNGTLGNYDMELLEQRWDSILQQLEDLQTQLKDLRKSEMFQDDNSKVLDLVIHADPHYPPYSAFVLLKLIAFRYKVNVTTHIHSSVSNVPENFNLIVNRPINFCSTGSKLNLMLIWKKVGKDPILVQCPISNGNVAGEVNIARYLNRLLEQRPEPFIVYESKGDIHGSQVDTWLDFVYKSVVRGSNKINSSAVNSLANVLNKQEWLAGSSVTIADICLWSCLKQNTHLTDSNSVIKKWFMNCSQHFGHL